MVFLANAVPTQKALQLGACFWTFAELQEEVRLYALKWQQLPKAILLLSAEPSFSFIAQFLAALQIGQPVALFSTSLSQEDIQSRLALLGNSMRVNHKGNLIELSDSKKEVHHPQLALVLFTSGSTAQVKAVQLSLKNIEANCKAVIKALEFSNVENQLVFLPLSYSFGLLGQLLPGLMAGITTVLIEQFIDIKSLLEQESIPQMWSGVPSHWVAISKMASLYPESAKKIKALVSAGAPLSLSLRAELMSTFSKAVVYNNYGLTEASPRVLTYSSKDPHFLKNYAGYPIGDWQIKLSPENELLIQGDQTMLGYLGENESTSHKDGWLSTGDVAEILPNKLVAIKGRRDSIVNIGGEKVNLCELEQRLAISLGIHDLIVSPREDALYGVRLIAFFEHGPLLKDSSENQLTEHIQRALSPKKIPITARLLAQLPRNPHGKLDRKALLKENTEPFICIN